MDCTLNRAGASYGIAFDDDELEAMQQIAPPTPKPSSTTTGSGRKAKPSPWAGYDNEERRMVAELGGSPLRVNWTEMSHLNPNICSSNAPLGKKRQAVTFGKENYGSTAREESKESGSGIEDVSGAKIKNRDSSDNSERRDIDANEDVTTSSDTWRARMSSMDDMMSLLAQKQKKIRHLVRRANRRVRRSRRQARKDDRSISQLMF